VIKAEFAGWEPLVEPSRCTSVVRTCRGILEDDGVGVTAEGIETMSLYETLCWEHVVPHLRTALGRWNTRDVLPAIELVETWEALLPGWMTTSVLEQVVMPKLVAGVDDWSPTSEATPVHSWLHPWLPLFGKEAMTPLYPPIRFKLASALQSGGWHPQDQSALAMVAPWKGVFTAKETARFLDRCVTPKLVAVLRDELQVNPNAQDVKPLKWVLAWAELYSATALGGMIDTHLARKLLRALAQWLSAESRSYIEVLEWYCGWKRLIGHALGATPPLRRLFARAADMLNRAALVELGHPNPPRKRVADTARPTVGAGGASVGEAQAAKRARGGAASSTRIPGDLGSVRDLVHKLADERGLTFMPKAGRTTEDGSQLYSLGGLTMFMDRGVIHARRPKGEYNPVSIDELMALATAH
jgi:tuftelin-interacting protein 11